MMRRFAVVGDKLSNNGEICDYKGPFFTLSGHQAALINGAAYCPVCKTTGYIAKEGGRRRMTLGASEIALENDVVICDCPDHPRIFARLAGKLGTKILSRVSGPSVIARLEVTTSLPRLWRPCSMKRTFFAAR